MADALLMLPPPKVVTVNLIEDWTLTWAWFRMSLRHGAWRHPLQDVVEGPAETESGPLVWMRTKRPKVCCREIHLRINTFYLMLAERKARRVLKQFISVKQWEEYRTKGYFHVHVNGRIYRLGDASKMRSGILGHQVHEVICEQCPPGRYVKSFCIHAPYDQGVFPDADYLWQFYLMLTVEEDTFLKVAHSVEGKDDYKRLHQNVQTRAEYFEEQYGDMTPECRALMECLDGVIEYPLPLMPEEETPVELRELRAQMLVQYNARVEELQRLAPHTRKKGEGKRMRRRIKRQVRRQCRINTHIDQAIARGVRITEAVVRNANWVTLDDLRQDLAQLTAAGAEREALVC